MAAPVSDEDMLMLYAAAVAVSLLILGALYMFCCKTKSAEPASSKASKVRAKDPKDAIANEWLQNTSAASEGKAKKSKRA